MSDSVDGECHSTVPFNESDGISQICNDDNSHISAASLSLVPPFVKTTSTNSTPHDDQSLRSSWSDASMGAIEGLVGTLRNSFRRLSHIGDSSKRGIYGFHSIILKKSLTYNLTYFQAVCHIV